LKAETSELHSEVAPQISENIYGFLLL